MKRKGRVDEEMIQRWKGEKRKPPFSWVFGRFLELGIFLANAKGKSGSASWHGHI